MEEHFKYKYDDLFNPVLNALHTLGGSGSIEEIEEQVAAILQLTDEQLNEIHRGTTSKFAYRLAWARTYLKYVGLLENSSRKVWALTEKGTKTTHVDKKTVKQEVNAEVRKLQLQRKTRACYALWEYGVKLHRWKETPTRVMSAMKNGNSSLHI